MEDLRAAVSRYFSDPEYRISADELYSALAVDAPVMQMGPVWLISGYDEIHQLCGSDEVSVASATDGVASPLTGTPTLAAAMSLMLPMRDGADHRRLKRLAAAAFSARRVATAAGHVDRCVDQLLRVKLPGGTLDVVADIAVPLPVALSCALLDIPEADRPQILDWAVLFRQQMGHFGQTSDAIAAVERDVAALMSYIQALCDDRRRRPGTDLVSQLAVAADGGRLDEDELAAFVLMLFVNGLETLTSGLTLAVFEMLQRPEMFGRLADDHALAPIVFDECLRLTSPVRASSRALLSDVVVGGRRIPAKSVVVLFFAAANRDPRRYEGPGELNLHRTDRHHLAFGWGPHHCLGAALSLGAGARVLTSLAEHCPDLRTEVTRQSAPWGRSLVFNSLRSLPVTFTPTAIDHDRPSASTVRR